MNLPPAPPPKPQMKPGEKRKALMAFGITAVVIGWFIVAGKNVPGPGGGSESNSHLLARTACEKFVEQAPNADLMTPDDLRAMLQDVWSTAQYTDDIAVREGARAMLAADTAIDVPAFSAATSRFTAACQPYLSGG